MTLLNTKSSLAFPFKSRRTVLGGYKNSISSPEIYLMPIVISRKHQWAPPLHVCGKHFKTPMLQFAGKRQCRSHDGFGG